MCRDKYMLQCGGYLLQFHLASDWLQNIFSGVHGFMGKTVKCFSFFLSLFQVLNEFFHNVCELDLVFNFYKVKLMGFFAPIYP